MIYNAVNQDDLDLFNTVLTCPQAQKEIVEILGDSLRKASARGHIKILKAILAHMREKEIEIPSQYLD